MTDPKPLSEIFKGAHDAIAERERRAREWELSPEGQRENAERAERERRRRVAERTERFRSAADDAHIPDELGLRTVALKLEPPVTEALTAYRDAISWREKSSTSIGRRPVVRLVAGPPGTGKSCALAWCATHHRRRSEWVSATQIAATPRNGWSANETRWDRWLEVDLLAVDEVGAEKGDATAIAYLLSERYNAGLATLLSGNLSRKDFTERYRDERLADRLRNGQGHAGGPDGLPWYVAVTGDSLRDPRVRAALVLSHEAITGAARESGMEE